VIRKWFCPLLIALVALESAVLASGEERLEAPEFKVGQWVSCTLTKDLKDGTKQTLEITYSIVGAEQYEGQDCLWHEMAFNISKTRRTVYRILLPTAKEVSAETMLCYISLVANIGDAKRYVLWVPGARPTEADMGVLKAVNDDLIKKGRRKAFAQDEPIKSLDEMKLKQKAVIVKTDGREFTCQLFAATLKSELSKHRQWKYQVWRSRKIPVFGFAKLRYEKVLFGKSEIMELLIKEFGFSGAKSVVPGELIKADMRIGKGPSAPKSE